MVCGVKCASVKSFEHKVVIAVNEENKNLEIGKTLKHKIKNWYYKKCQI